MTFIFVYMVLPEAIFIELQSMQGKEVMQLCSKITFPFFFAVGESLKVCGCGFFFVVGFCFFFFHFFSLLFYLGGVERLLCFVYVPVIVGEQTRGQQFLLCCLKEVKN